jgi:hypothetical protein
MPRRDPVDQALPVVCARFDAIALIEEIRRATRGPGRGAPRPWDSSSTTEAARTTRGASTSAGHVWLDPPFWAQLPTPSGVVNDLDRAFPSVLTRKRSYPCWGLQAPPTHATAEIKNGGAAGVVDVLCARTSKKDQQPSFAINPSP